MMGTVAEKVSRELKDYCERFEPRSHSKVG